MDVPQMSAMLIILIFPTPIIQNPSPEYLLSVWSSCLSVDWDLSCPMNHGLDQ
jgi:hypothetical protein